MQFPDLSGATLTLNAQQLENFIAVLVDVRSRLLPPAGAGESAQKPN